MLTIMCNLNYNELKDELLEDQNPQDRPNFLVRIFHVKFNKFKDDIIQKSIGKVLAYAYVIEYQKKARNMLI